MSSLNEMPAWRDLVRERDALAGQSLRALFAADPQRFAHLNVSAAGLLLDFSKQRLVPATIDKLVALAAARGLPAAIAAMFAGAPINRSENRPAWHVALRAPKDSGTAPQVHAVLAAMADFTQGVRSGRWAGFRGDRITAVVNLGIGGSDLGPRLVCDALAPAGDGPRTHFVANVDPDELDRVLAKLNPATTLFVVTSKSFTTEETLANASAARVWLRAAGAQETDIARHFVAVSANPQAVAAFGIERVFEFWDWVGGRFSLWSAAGLAIALALGMEGFRALLAGAHAMDSHFRQAPLARNLPVLMGLVGVWNRNFLDLPGLVVAPYGRRLQWFCAWLQQVEMESNGKALGSDGARVPVATSPAVWGGVGTNAQHAFFQMLHQGSDILPVDFVLALTDPKDDDGRAGQLAANCLAQSEAMMNGRDQAALRAQLARQGFAGAELEAAAAQRSFEGNRPSNTLLLDRLDPATLGALLAAYEHKVFVAGVIWGINSFDQWGVELGKTLAEQIRGELAGGASQPHDPSTAALLACVRRGSIQGG